MNAIEPAVAAHLGQPPVLQVEGLSVSYRSGERVTTPIRVSYLFISHDLTTVRYLCHRVAVMYLGQIVEAGTVEQIFALPRHPYARALLSAHLSPDPMHRRVDHPSDEQSKGEIPSPIDLPAGCFLASRCSHVLPRCMREPQNLVPVGDGRMVRCWRVASGDVALGATPQPASAH
jgi:oligopeptide/dipeptide ABC transporter ATP-binding protein